MDWLMDAEYNHSNAQSALPCENDTVCHDTHKKNPSLFSPYPLQNKKQYNTEFCSLSSSVIQLRCQGEDETLTNQDYKANPETSPALVISDFNDQLYCIKEYSHRYSSDSLFLQNAKTSQSFEGSYIPVAYDSSGACYLSSNSADNKRRRIQINCAQKSSINSFTHSQCNTMPINYDEYSITSSCFDHQADSKLQKPETIYQQPPISDYSAPLGYQEAVIDSDSKRKNDVLVGARTLICRWKSCYLAFTDHKSFVNHIETSHVASHISSKEYCCYWEGCRRQLKPFNARYKLIVHLRIHNGDRPSKCLYPDCCKAFSRLENLKIHMRSHTGERPFICQQDGCNRAFSNSSDRAKHQRTHIHIKPYACKVFGCTKRYTDPSSLRKHLKSHSMQEFSVQNKNSTMHERMLIKINNISNPVTSCSSQVSGYTSNTMENSTEIKTDPRHFLKYNSDNNIASDIKLSYDNLVPTDHVQNNIQYSFPYIVNAQTDTRMENNSYFACSCNSSQEPEWNVQPQFQSNYYFTEPTSWKDEVTPVLSPSIWDANKTYMQNFNTRSQ
ncbi:unnamed protein product [Trichobilharzia szidati]|nr:unnamed protein product [Trichobilharzia szidati]